MDLLRSIVVVDANVSPILLTHWSECGPLFLILIISLSFYIFSLSSCLLTEEHWCIFFFSSAVIPHDCWPSGWALNSYSGSSAAFLQVLRSPKQKLSLPRWYASWNEREVSNQFSEKLKHHEKIELSCEVLTLKRLFYYGLEINT